jgi:hypothetical protein
MTNIGTGNFLGHARPTDRRFPLLERADHGILVHVVGSDPSCRARHIGDCRAIQPGHENAAVEWPLKNQAFVQKSLQGDAIGENLRADDSRHFVQHLQALAKLAINLCGNHRNRRELLCAEHALHILAQHLAGIERQRPQADYENGQREQRHPGFE